MKKVTIQDIADSLGVSRITAWKVINDKPGVSENMKRKVVAKAKELKYWSFAGDSANEDPINVSLVISRPNKSIFLANVISQIAMELNRKNINLVYNYIFEGETGDYSLPKIIKSDQIKGLIVVNVYNDKLIKQLSSIDLPKVFFDTVAGGAFETLNGDAVLIESRETVAKIVQQMGDLGKKTYAFIGNTYSSKTNHYKWLGFKDALSAQDLSVISEACMTDLSNPESERESVLTFLRNLKKFPDAFVCTDDYIACMVMQFVRDKGLRIPDDIVVSGFGDYDDLFVDNTNLITAKVRDKSIGKMMVHQLLYRIENPELDFITSFVSSKVIQK